MSTTQVRATMPSDLDDLAAALVRVHETDGYPVEGVDDPHALLAPIEPIGQWTALLDDTPAGHVALLRATSDDPAASLLRRCKHVPLEGVAILARLFVDPAARGHGMANALMATAEDFAQNAELCPVLEVLDKDGAAKILYKRRGWRTLGPLTHPVPGQPDMPATVMTAATVALLKGSN